MSVFIGFVSDAGKLTLDFPKQMTAYLKHLAGHEVEVEIRKRRSRRSADQNRGFHAMIAPWAKSEGHDVDDLKSDLMGTVFGWAEKRTLADNRVPLRRHTSELNTAEFSELIDRTLQIAAECGVILQAPDEYTAKRRGPVTRPL